MAFMHRVVGGAPSDWDTTKPIGLVVWGNESEIPAWFTEVLAGQALEGITAEAYIALRVDDLTSMYAAVKAGFGMARMPCYMPESMANKSDGSEIKRLDITLERSPWSVWVLSHVDLRKTARVQQCRQFLMQALESKRDLFEGQ